MSDNFNPYSNASIQYSMPVSRPMRLADLGKRLLGAIIDGLFGMFAVVPGYAVMTMDVIRAGEGGEPGPLFFVGVLLILLGFVVSIGVQIFLLVKSSQTVGKYLMKTQIVDYQTGQPADFVHSFLLRLLVNGLIGAVPCVGAIYSLVDICFIFREDRRCIHDHIASTCVVDIS